MRLRFVSWNVDGLHPNKGQPSVLAEAGWDLCALQEVRAPTLTACLEVAGLDPSCGVLAEPLVPASAQDVKTPFFSALIARPPLRLVEPAVLDLPSPKRTLVARVTGGQRDVMVASLALPPGVEWGGERKVEQAQAIAGWLRRRELPTVIGIDANTPKWDRLELSDTEWWYPGEAVLLGVERDHDLRDVYREHVRADSERWAQLVRERPDGPVEVSHRRRGTDCRYDFILASPELSVATAGYAFHEASDHAMVVAELDLKSIVS
jgi:endonuclease/exonuclease/phosphatase family metal-dependent hydrolase